jgi:2-oxoglutarate ferredoxin oxidoreductase subunit delta
MGNADLHEAEALNSTGDLRLKIKQGNNHMAKPTLESLDINTEWCKGCGICVAFCPKKVWELDRKDKAVPAHSDDCICCRMCELRCPDLAIEVQTINKEKKK